ncbi:hypothetical protein CDAR_253441 [Caerostris darwini]|uniref:Uncharacterized protein n=1 Tax=Caerostris darwini TaxID=1538125 RepID=A0AAV4MKD9_9ARAC|nr:hypothetical protein CDAR_253441 [Caerostris darwini]
MVQTLKMNPREAFRQEWAPQTLKSARPHRRYTIRQCLITNPIVIISSSTVCSKHPRKKFWRHTEYLIRPLPIMGSPAFLMHLITGFRTQIN